MTLVTIYNTSKYQRAAEVCTKVDADRPGPARFWSHCEVVLALSIAHPLCWPVSNVRGASALDALVSPLQLYSRHPALFLKPAAQ